MINFYKGIIKQFSLEVNLNIKYFGDVHIGKIFAVLKILSKQI